MLEKYSTTAPSTFDKTTIINETDRLVEKLRELQSVMYAENKNSMLVILQGMDASGKDSTVKHVFGKINPMGVRVKPFKKPTPEEYAYDFIRRVHKHTPPTGMIHIFNRSHYEDILVPEVHNLYSADKIKRRYDYVNGFENLLTDSNTHILKFYLHISRDEQVRRFRRRLTKPDKHWKYDPADISESRKWDEYMEVYEKIFKKCSPEIPWIIVPSDDKWYRNYLVAKHVVKALDALDMKYPKGYFDDENNRIEAEKALEEYKKR
ncbi:MAG TPA: polyphosphate kinase 2 family protein [Bacteroidales bacterium]|nr:polyphosphate kinase 2 family protein [Bacteroidales bacterium]